MRTSTIKRTTKETDITLSLTLEGSGKSNININAEKIVMDWIASKEYHLGAVMNAFRLAVVGACRGPHMFDITELMPKSEVIARVRRAIDTINK